MYDLKTFRLFVIIFMPHIELLVFVLVKEMIQSSFLKLCSYCISSLQSCVKSVMTMEILFSPTVNIIIMLPTSFVSILITIILNKHFLSMPFPQTNIITHLNHFMITSLPICSVSMNSSIFLSIVFGPLPTTLAQG